MKVLLVLLFLGLLAAAIIGFFKKMTEWADSSNETKSNFGCGVLGIIFLLIFILATVGTIKSCIH